MLIAHGLQKAFGLWGGPGLNGWEDSLSTMGFKYADILTYVATGGQIAAGVLLVLGSSARSLRRVRWHTW